MTKKESNQRRQELQQIYKETKKESGVFQIRNTVNDKRWISSTKNLRSLNGKRMELDMGKHMNHALQLELNEFGSSAFEIEVLEVLKVKETGYFDEDDALRKLEDKWLEQLQPYDDRGYHKRKPE
ncbi:MULTISPECIES: GIY-YIG nuclease family protein [Paenibacillus]|uniref:GIY-YIG nuclease family protein n=1 Tax=Paenibacillus violae TaxID=3077234 RepID=A0ABU3R7W3_9BACL|nr:MULTISPECIES: GIY-YIG nuclease family protein [Paenibacillus]MDU0200368.1 GIY-YIG nuclease family protein [Paenibacillus sp. PFR10]MEC0265836.1 GIY-YIG nuclease family protein [Paenibacillus anseongense]